MDADPGGKPGDGLCDLACDRLRDRDLAEESLQQRELTDLLEVDQAARVLTT
jgi:hypothetical protein